MNPVSRRQFLTAACVPLIPVPKSFWHNYESRSLSSELKHYSRILVAVIDENVSNGDLRFSKHCCIYQGKDNEFNGPGIKVSLYDFKQVNEKQPCIGECKVYQAMNGLYVDIQTPMNLEGYHPSIAFTIDDKDTEEKNGYTLVKKFELNHINVGLHSDHVNIDKRVKAIGKQEN